MAWNNDSKNSSVFTEQAVFFVDMTWDDATFAWDDARGTWDKPNYPYTNQSKNAATFTELNKS